MDISMIPGGRFLNHEDSTYQTTVITSVIISHNTRIQCFLRKFQTFANDKIRFQNGCILKVYIDGDGNATVNLVYSGDLDSSEKKGPSITRPYYVVDKGADVDGYIKFPTLNAIAFTLSDGNQYNFYIIRHGQAEHNRNPAWWNHRVRNTRLTDIGQGQGEKTGAALLDILSNNSPTYWFVSDLRRTGDTLASIWRGIYNAPGSNINPFEVRQKYFDNIEKVFVLPCSHELKTEGRGEGTCDAEASSYVPSFAMENYTSCTRREINSGINNCNTVDVHYDNQIKSVNINWDFYNVFYSGFMRNQLNKFTSSYSRYKNRQIRNYCRDTNMISLAILFIQNEGVVDKAKLNQFILDTTKDIPRQRFQKFDEGSSFEQPVYDGSSTLQNVVQNSAQNQDALTQSLLDDGPKKKWWHRFKLWGGGKTRKSNHPNKTMRNRRNNKRIRTCKQKKIGRQNKRRIRTTKV